MFRTNRHFSSIACGLARRFLLGLTAVCYPLSLHAAETTNRAGSLPHAIETLAENVAAFCTKGEERVGIVKIKDFSMPERYKTSAGRTLRDQMTQALTKLKVTVDNSDFGKSTHIIAGSCFVEEKQNEVVLMMIVSLFRTDRNIEIVGFREHVKAVEVSDREAISQTLGTTFDVALTAKPKTAAETEQVASAQDATFNNSVKNPTVSITSPVGQTAKQTIISPSLSSKFKIEILVKNAGNDLVPTPAIDANGLAVVVGLKRKEVFGVRIYNDFDFDVAVKLALDGINCFALSDNPDYRNQGVWIIPRNSNATVTGWHLNNGQVREFLVTDYEDAIAKRLGGPAEGIGVIQAQFFPAWSLGEPQPIQEQKAEKDAGPLGIGAGVVRESVSQPMRRFIGTSLLGAITVRYSRPEPPADLPK